MFKLKSALCMFVRASKASEFIPHVSLLKLPAVDRGLFTALYFFF